MLPVLHPDGMGFLSHGAQGGTSTSRTSAHSLTNERLAQRPNGAGYALTVGNNRLESLRDVFAIRGRNDKSWQKFYNVTRVTATWLRILCSFSSGMVMS